MTVQSVYEEWKPALDKETIEAIVPYEAYLVQSGLNLDDVDTHPGLSGQNKQDLAEWIDGIHTAARAGNVYANYLLRLAAEHEVEGISAVKSTAFYPDVLEPIEPITDDKDDILPYSNGLPPTANKWETVRMLDESWATIEIIDEQFARGLLEPDEA